MVKSLTKTSSQEYHAAIKNDGKGLPCGPVVKNLPCSAGDVGSIPVWGTKIPCAIKQVSLHTATEDPVCHR